jgi:hypothetical protein
LREKEIKLKEMDIEERKKDRIGKQKETKLKEIEIEERKKDRHEKRLSNSGI